MNQNFVSLVGTLERDVENTVIEPSGTQMAKFRMKTQTAYRRSTGGSGLATEYHTVVCFDPHSVFAAKDLRKGALVLIEGRLQTRSWEVDGATHYRTEIVASRLDSLAPTTEPVT